MKRILWFRRDLRFEDNPILSLDGEVLPIFIFDTNILDSLQKNDKRVSFIFHTLLKLKNELKTHALDLKVFYAKPEDVFEYLSQYNFDEVVASGDYEQYAKKRDLQISHKLHFRYLQDTYLFKHNEILKEDGTPYLVFTPFYKKARAQLANKNIQPYTFAQNTLAKTTFDTITKISQDTMMHELPFELQSIGFKKIDLEIISPQEKLEIFTKHIHQYKEKRDFLEHDVGSNLSVDLRFGTISTKAVARYMLGLRDVNAEPFIRQLIFRDFYAYLLFHFPYIQHQNYKYEFNGIEDTQKFELFCKAQTGVPIIDAGIRELLQTGTMHNRIRMVTASFLTKDLLLPWQWGERFFAEHLLDFDVASNVLSWQWSAGTGIDPQPYFRVFNPYLQSKKFDKEAKYIKKFIPELKHVDAKHLHDENYLLENFIQGYSKPIVHHKEAAKRAVEMFKR